MPELLKREGASKSGEPSSRGLMTGRVSGCCPNMGYTEKQLDILSRATTETGTTIEGPITREIHGLSLMNLYLAQFKRG